MINQKKYIISGIVLSILIIISALTVAKSRLSLSGRAENKPPQMAISLENSYLFASPGSVSADGLSLIRITAYLIDSRGLGLSGKKVTLKGPPELIIREVASVTDNFGRAIFDVFSRFAGSYTIRSEVDAVFLPATVAVVFR